MVLSEKDELSPIKAERQLVADSMSIAKNTYQI